MAIRTQAITYRRGILPSQYAFYNNFFLTAQTNNAIVSPMNSYLRRYKFTNRNYINFFAGRTLWKP